MQDKNTQQNTSYRYTTCSEVCDNVIFKNPANDNYKKIMFKAIKVSFKFLNCLLLT